MVYCHVIWHDHIKEARLLSPQWVSNISPITAIVSDDSMISVSVWSSPHSRHLQLCCQSTLVSDLDPLWPLPAPRQLIASPVSQWATPLSAQRLQFLILKNRCCFPRPLPSQFSNQESGVRTVVRCINSAQADLAQPLEFYIFSPKIC